MPYSKAHYRWYLNLDGTVEQTADVKVNGRKTNAAVAFCDEGEIPPVHFKEIIFFNILKQEIKNKKSFFVDTLHRQLLKLEIRSKFYFTFAIGFDEAQSFRKAGGQYLRPSQWEDITVEVIF